MCCCTALHMLRWRWSEPTLLVDKLMFDKLIRLQIFKRFRILDNYKSNFEGIVWGTWAYGYGGSPLCETTQRNAPRRSSPQFRFGCFFPSSVCARLLGVSKSNFEGIVWRSYGHTVVHHRATAPTRPNTPGEIFFGIISLTTRKMQLH